MRRRQKIKGVTRVIAAAVRRRRASATPSRRRAPGATPSRSSGTPPARPPPTSNSEKAKEEYARQGQGSERQGDRVSTRSAMRSAALGSAAKVRGGGLLVGVLLSRPDGADELRRQGRRRTASRPKSGPARSSARSPRGVIAGVLKTTPDKIKMQPAAAGRRLRPAHLAGRRGAGGGALQHHQEAGEADPHARGRRRRPRGRGR